MPDNHSQTTAKKTGQPVVIFTGGHHTSALEVAKRLRSQGWKIIWFGHKYSMWGDTAPSAEFHEVTGSGIEFIELKAGKLYHTYHPLKLLRIPYGFIRSLQLIKKLKKQYGDNLKGIVTFGGYLGVPVVFAGSVFGLPTISHEQTTAIGLANRFISVLAKKTAVAWPSSVRGMINPRVCYVGLPVRKEISKLLIHPPQRKKMIYITGGKQGSHVINDCVFGLLPQLLNEFTVVHQTGSSSVYGDYETAVKIKAGLPESLQKKYYVHKYLDAPDAARALAEATVVIGRSGAHIVYELGLLGTRSVLIPIPWSSGQEQLKNARVLEDNRQAVILSQSQLTPSRLFAAISDCLHLSPKPLNLPLDATDRMVNLIKAEL